MWNIGRASKAGNRVEESRQKVDDYDEKCQPDTLKKDKIRGSISL